MTANKLDDSRAHMRVGLMLAFIGLVSHTHAFDQTLRCSELVNQGAAIFYDRDPLHQAIQKFIDPTLSLQNLLDLVRSLKWDQITPFHQKYIVDQFYKRIAKIEDQSALKAFPIYPLIRFIRSNFDVAWFPVLQTLSAKLSEFPKTFFHQTQINDRDLPTMLGKIRSANHRTFVAIRDFENRDDAKKRQLLYSNLDWQVLSASNQKTFLEWAHRLDLESANFRYEIEGLLSFFDKYRDRRFLGVLDLFQRQLIKISEGETSDANLNRVRLISFAIATEAQRFVPTPLGRVQILDLIAKDFKSIAYAIHAMALDNRMYFTDHALRRMSERMIPRALIDEAFALGNKGALTWVADDYSPKTDSVIFKWSYRSRRVEFKKTLHIILTASPLTGDFAIITAFFDEGKARSHRLRRRP